jgi:enoyl-CoA hydratase
MPIHRTLDAGVAVLTLDLGRGNAIDHAFIEALEAALDAALAEGARAVVLTGRGKVFCGGLDLVTLAAYDHAEMARFVDAFDDCFRKVLAYPRPVVAAVNGHALAGGAILAFACDHRVAQPGPFFLGLNEVELGISFPAGAFEIARRSVPERSIGAVLLEGRRFSPEEALAAGLVHALAPEGGALAAATAQAARFAAGGVEAVADVKADLVAPVLGRIAATTAMRKERFLARWFAPEARRRIAALVERLGKR